MLRRRSSIELFAFCLLFFCTSHAHARIGEGPLHKLPNSATLLGSPIVNQVTTQPEGANYVIHVLKTESGMILTEYAFPQGRVFAAAWQGTLVHPEMNLILSSRYREKTEAQKSLLRSKQRHILRDPWHSEYKKMKTQKGQKRSHVEATEIVYETWGQLRNLGGRAYLRSDVQSLGLNAEDIVGVMPNGF